MKIPRTLMLAGKVSWQRTDRGRRFRSAVPCHENHPTDGMSPRRPQSAVPFPVHQRRCRPSVRPSGWRKYSTDKNGLQHLAHLNRSPFGSPARRSVEEGKRSLGGSVRTLHAIFCAEFLAGKYYTKCSTTHYPTYSRNKLKQKSAVISVY